MNSLLEKALVLVASHTKFKRVNIGMSMPMANPNLELLVPGLNKLLGKSVSIDDAQKCTNIHALLALWEIIEPPTKNLELPFNNEDIVLPTIRIDYLNSWEGTISRDLAECDEFRGSPFNENEGPVSIIIPQGAERIGKGIFCDCRWLKQVKIPNSVKVIGEGAFCGTGLRECFIPEGVEIIERAAFFSSELETVFLPKSLKRIEDAFISCPLKQMYIEVENPNEIISWPEGDGSDYWGCDVKNCTLTVPRKYLDIYRSHWAFKDFMKIIPL